MITSLAGDDVTLPRADSVRRRTRRIKATQLMPFNIEAAVKVGVLYAQEGALSAAVEWFVAAAERSIYLAKEGVCCSV